MNLITFKHRYDFGHDWYVQILNTARHVPNPFKNLSLIQASVSWNDYASWPYIQIKSGSGTLFSVVFWCHRFGFDIGFFERTWTWDYMEEIEWGDEDAMPPWGHSDMEALSKGEK